MKRILATSSRNFFLASRHSLMEPFKDLITFLISPLSIAIIMASTGWGIYRTKRKRLAIAFLLGSTVVLLLGSLSGWTYDRTRRLEYTYPPFEIDQHDRDPNQPTVIAVLGTGFNADELLPANSRVTGSFHARLLEGLRIYRAIPDSKLHVSIAGKAPDQAKTEFLSDITSLLDIAPERITALTSAESTEDEAEAIKNSYPDNAIILVTSASHMPRAIDTFARQNVAATPAPCDYSTTRAASPNDKPWQRWIPSPDGLGRNHQFARELMASVWQRVKGTSDKATD